MESRRVSSAPKTTELRGFDDICTAPKTLLVSDMDQLGDHGESMGFKTLKIRGTSVLSKRWKIG